MKFNDLNKGWLYCIVVLSQYYISLYISQFQFILIFICKLYRILQINQMKKFKLESVKKQEQTSTKKIVEKQKKTNEEATKELTEKQQKKSQIQKQMQILNAKINDANKNIQQTEKLLDIDLFLKKQKQKSKQYAKKLTQEYQHKKKQRQATLYNKNNTKQSQKPISIMKNVIPIKILTGIKIISQDNQIKKWIIEGHHDNIDKLISNNTFKELFDEQSLTLYEEKCLKSKSQHSWKNIRQISKNSVETQIFPIKIQQNQLQPSDYGQLIISALNLMPQKLSIFLYEQKEKENKDYLFLCRFYPGGQRKSVLTNSCIEVREYVHKYININSRHSNGTIFWSSLLQKCMKKLYYQQIFPSSVSEMVSTIYGIQPQIIQFTNKTINRQNFDNILQFLINQDPKVLIGFYNDQHLSPNRIYPLASIVKPALKNLKKAKKQQKVQNQQIIYTINNNYSKFGEKSNIKNKLKYNELFEQFNKLIVLRQYPADWGGLRIFAQFFSNGPLNSINSQWIKNNQYSFTLARDAAIRIIMRRRWGTYLQNINENKMQNLLFGFAIFKSQNGQTQINSMKLDSLITKSKSSDQNGCLFNGLLMKSTYIVVPFTNLISKQYTQSFILDLITQKQEFISINKSRLSDVYYQNIQANENKTIQKLQAKIKYQKPKNQKLILPKLYLQKRDNKKKIINTINLNDQQQKQLLIPGFLNKFISRSDIPTEKNINGNNNKNKKEIKYKSQQQMEIQQEQRQEGLKFLLGYDLLMSEQINHGQMLSIIEQTSEELDFANFYLGQEGLLGILQNLLSVPRLTKINLSNNNLNDSAITYLCYYLQKGRRNQLRQLILKDNTNITKMGKQALNGLKNIFTNLKIIV